MCYLQCLAVLSCFDIFAIITLLVVAGFEPLTIGLWGECSTNVLLSLGNVLFRLYCHNHSPRASRIEPLTMGS
jgi:hypothetical protein